MKELSDVSMGTVADETIQEVTTVKLGRNLAQTSR